MASPQAKSRVQTALSLDSGRGSFLNSYKENLHAPLSPEQAQHRSLFQPQVRQDKGRQHRTPANARRLPSVKLPKPQKKVPWHHKESRVSRLMGHGIIRFVKKGGKVRPAKR